MGKGGGFGRATDRLFDLCDFLGGGRGRLVMIGFFGRGGKEGGKGGEEDWRGLTRGGTG